MLVTKSGADDVLDAAALETTVLEGLLTLTLIGISVVETTVDLTGQLVTSGAQDVTVETSVLYMVIVKGPPGFVSLVALYPTTPGGNGVVDERSFALCKRHSKVFWSQVAAKHPAT